MDAVTDMANLFFCRGRYCRYMKRLRLVSDLENFHHSAHEFITIPQFLFQRGDFHPLLGDDELKGKSRDLVTAIHDEGADLTLYE
ncbi:unnamed protein product [Sphagnum jensenii]|uniref:Uncharacterized protein n=1 Tax=Sphagnum jensenii TaxID=128206 RepID=A0ABP1BJJ4_9BRYO